MRFRRDPLQGTTGNVDLRCRVGGERSRRRPADVRVGNGKLRLRRGWRRPPVRRCEHAGGRGRQLAVAERLRQRRLSSWTGAKGYFGGSYGTTTRSYGIPVVEGGHPADRRRGSTASRCAAARSDLTGAFDSFRATLTVRRYKHEELEGEEVGTAFKNDTDRSAS